MLHAHAKVSIAQKNIEWKVDLLSKTNLHDPWIYVLLEILCTYPHIAFTNCLLSLVLLLLKDIYQDFLD